MGDVLACGTDLAGFDIVDRSINDSAPLLRLPPPPKSPRVTLDGAECQVDAACPTTVDKADGREVAASHVRIAQQVPSITSTGLRPELAARRPSLEALLNQAESLANALSVSDPRGRLLQIALLRRDYTLIEAVLTTLGRQTQPSRTQRPRPTQSQLAATMRPQGSARRQNLAEKSAARPRSPHKG